MKGIVMEIHGKKATIMQNSGAFAEVPANPEWRMGDIVDIPKKKQRLPLAWIAAAACILLFLGLGGRQVYYAPAALLSIDVNPSIELQVNRFGRIIAQIAVNDDAQALLQKANLTHLSYTDALDALFSQADFQQYLEKNAYLLCTVQTQNAERQEDMLREIEARTAPLSEAAVDIYAVDEEIVHAAHGHGITAGKYLIIEELAALDETTDIDECAHNSITEIRARIDAHHAQREGHSSDGATEGGHASSSDGDEHSSGNPSETGEHSPNAESEDHSTSVPESENHPTSTPEKDDLPTASPAEKEHSGGKKHGNHGH